MRELSETYEEWHAGHCYEKRLGLDCSHHGGAWRFLFDAAKEQQAELKKVRERIEVLIKEAEAATDEDELYGCFVMARKLKEALK
jgi:hypothetical protein